MVRSEFQIWQDELNRRPRRGPSYGVLGLGVLMISLAGWAVVIFTLRHVVR